jgi:putative transcriptional regulator
MDHLRRIAVLLLAIWATAPIWPRAAETSAPAVFLVAKPELQDPNFAQSVVLVVFPKEGGSLGVILNRPLTMTVKEAFPAEPQLKGRDDTLYLGGPVRATALMYLFQGSTGPDNALPVVDDLYFSGDGPLLDELLSGQSARVQRFFLGYAGWADTQLDVEVAQGSWYVMPADLDTVLKGNPETLWRDLLLRATAVKT